MGRRAARRLRDQRGITLIELLISMMIASIISSMLLVSWFALQSSYYYSINSNNARDKGRQALSRLEREVRDAEQVPGTFTQMLPLQGGIRLTDRT